ncbi:hypothetical protein CHU_2281 [Cytophaga hutchinsonii ATCC 33406]|uniref:Uncharacterized protein n=1 Tax=Cytophaga hutchinsonii (strain ATCC 33406 / DSM 1761 / CIP 103989 / NBRC 15051 / NCIMB 9469 / D465) TaxID=269798 RepID=A0A6N4STB7_CYTH3|nr:hypothetical protein CHU_2281 [Cytophaga hutchinsonii ATCC 33406]
MIFLYKSQICSLKFYKSIRYNLLNLFFEIESYFDRLNGIILRKMLNRKCNMYFCMISNKGIYSIFYSYKK